MQLMYKITAKVRWCRILHLVQEEDTPLAASNQKVKTLVQVVYAIWGNSLYNKRKSGLLHPLFLYYTIRFTNLDSESNFHSMSTELMVSDRDTDELQIHVLDP